MNRSDLEKKLDNREFLTPDEGLWMYENLDLYALGELAARRRLEYHGRHTFYIRNRHIDYSNVCVLSCKFCAFARKKGEAGAFEYSVDEIVNKATEGLAHHITELHIVGGFHPTHPFEFYTDMLRAIKAVAPSIHLKCFTAAEIDYFSRRFKQPIETILSRLREAGLDSLPGGGAEILAPEVRQEICGPKGDAERWINVHRIAHTMGFKSNATMLYGHIESPRDWFEHMRQIRDLQAETGGFLSFIPLAFNPQDTIYEPLGYTSAYLDLKIIALARLFLPNILHIKGYWVMSGTEVAQLAQDFGADDLHGTVIEENITAMAGGRAPQGLSADALHALIEEAGYTPVERDSFYRPIAASVQNIVSA